jgi:hypothetical protein
VRSDPLRRLSHRRTGASDHVASGPHALAHVVLSFVLAALFAWWALVHDVEAAHADEPVRVEIRAPADLRPGMHANITVRVTLPQGKGTPLLLTPKAEGSAVEVVRGRLFRADAKTLPDGTLTFELPVLARSEGTAILRVEVMTYVCNARCERVTYSESQVLRVHGR